MPAKRRTTPQAARTALLDAAASLFASEGFEAANTNRIARSAGLGVGTFYRHFADKQALADALMLQTWEDLGGAMPGPEVRDPATFARMATSAAIEFALADPARFRAAFGWARRARVTLSMRPIERRFRELAEEPLRRAGLEPALAARAWWTQLREMLLWWLEDPSRAPRDELEAALTRLHPLAMTQSAET